ncbi:hypothetical protein HU200_066145 [Digitaria exilis]|uniref:GDSL esterase/lipase n=1 Tax=Digitaria exilis TaxID=1010633 RepID=A0A835A0N7_9POAL|nr:hypothetical protein HU200_066145 [Digitaria exilis]
MLARRHPVQPALPLPLLLLLAVAPTVRARVTALIVFGDSTVDAGNNTPIPTVVRSNFPPYGRDFPGATGRFSNGRVATDFYSEALGLGRDFVPAYLDPDYGIQDFAIGVCFASAGSGLDVATSRVFGHRGAIYTLKYYKVLLADGCTTRQKMRGWLPTSGAAEAHAVVAGAVYAVSIGTNDFIENYYALTTTRFLEFTVPEIGFTGLAAMGCLPWERARARALGTSGGCDERYNAAARAFNAALAGMVAELGGELPGAEIRVAEV